MRYNRLRDLGLTEDQIKNNLLFSGEKVGDMMTIAMRLRTRKPGSAQCRRTCR
jgi:hypothetical protein